MSERESGYGNSAHPGRPLSVPRAASQLSLEDRLQYLQRGVERLSKLRAGLSEIADRISLAPEKNSSGETNGPAIDLSSRFGETIGHVHNNLDELDRLVNRIGVALFSSNQAQAAGMLG